MGLPPDGVPLRRYSRGAYTGHLHIHGGPWGFCKGHAGFAFPIVPSQRGQVIHMFGFGVCDFPAAVNRRCNAAFCMVDPSHREAAKSESHEGEVPTLGEKSRAATGLVCCSDPDPHLVNHG